MSEVLRVPDQFRPSRGNLRGATPTCGGCCCCCCCAATVLTASVVLPVRVMASERRHGIPRGRRAGAQVLAALTPAISVGAAVATGYATKNAVIAFVVAVVLFPLLSGGAFARRRVGAGLLATLAFLAAFAVEIFAGGLLLLRTPALYAVVAIAVAAVIGWLEIRGLRRMDGHAS